MARDAAKITDHPIADFLALFSMLLPLPLTAGLDFPYYYNCQKDLFSRRGHFQSMYFFNLCNSILCIKFAIELPFFISCNFYKPYDAFLRYPDVISDSKSQRNTCAITLYSNHSFLLDRVDTC